MKRYIAVIFLGWFAFAGSISRANTDDVLSAFEEANQAYINGEYSYAAELYENILSSGVESAELFYNLGNAYFKMNQLASAILNYERASLLKPFDEQIEHNLQIARARTVDRVEQLPVIFYQRWWNKLVLIQSVDGWARTGIFSLLASLMVLIWFFFSRTPAQKKISFLLTVIFILFTSLGFYLANRQYKDFFLSRDAIVFSSRVAVKSGPGELSPDLFVIHEGTKVRITEELGDWLEIKLENGHVGWLKQSHVRAVRASDVETP